MQRHRGVSGVGIVATVDSKTSSLTASQRILRCLAISLLIVYAIWQAVWLVGGRIPPSLLVALTGWPAPTTGGTRSVQALMSGDWRLSLYHNPMTLPIVVVFVITVAWILRNLRELHAKSLPRPVVFAWIAVLGLAWAIKVAQALWETH